MGRTPEIVEQLKELEAAGKLRSDLPTTVSLTKHTLENMINNPPRETILSSKRPVSIPASLQKSEQVTKIIENSRMLFELSPEAIAILDATGVIVDANTKFFKWLEYSKEEILGKTIFTMPFFSDEQRITLKHLISQQTTNGKNISQELCFIKKNNKKRYGMTHFTPIKNHEGAAIGIILMISDITNLKMAEEEINKLSQFHESIIENANVWLSVMDPSSNIIIWNKAAETITGYSREEVIGNSNIWEWLKPDKKQYYRWTTKTTSQINDENIFVEPFETTIKRKDGQIRTISWNSRVLTDSRKNPIGTLTLGHDITEQKKSEEKIKKQNRELKKLNRIKSDFLNVTSHELRTPMVAIKGYAQLLSDLSLGDITEKQKKAIDVILRNTNRLSNLVQDILDVSRLESGTMKFIPVETNIKKLIQEVSETMQSSARAKEITINTSVEEDIPSLVIDPERIKQVLINLINNAIKFSPPASSINLQVKRQDDYLLFNVQDFGRGIPQDKQDKIFEVFYQVDSAEDRKRLGGAGLGLAISKGIVVAHGGNIWVESIIGKGSTFYFTLPIKPVTNPEERFKQVNIFSTHTCDTS